MRRLACRAAAVFAAACACGCAGVEPWQRGYLARPDMAFELAPGTAKAIDKIYGAKEAASGAGAVGGGGCGCH